MSSLLIALPTAGRVETPFLSSMLALCDALGRAGMPYAVKTYQFSDIVMSRNYLMSYFLSNEEYDRVLMLDSDLSFEPEQFFRLLDFDADFVAAVCPFRYLDPSRLVDKAASGEPDPLPAALDYIMTLSMEAERRFEPEYRNGFQTVSSIGAGFMLLKRAVPERMVQTGAARPLPGNARGSGHVGADRFADFFSHLLSPDRETMFGEDQSFCRRWVIDCAGDIWVDTHSRVTHHGAFAFRGDTSVLLK